MTHLLHPKCSNIHLDSSFAIQRYRFVAVRSMIDPVISVVENAYYILVLFVYRIKIK